MDSCLRGDDPVARDLRNSGEVDCPDEPGNHGGVA